MISYQIRASENDGKILMRKHIKINIKIFSRGGGPSSVHPWYPTLKLLNI